MLLLGIVAYLLVQIAAGRDALASLSVQWDWLGTLGALIAAIAAYQCLFLAWLLLLRRTGYYRRGRTGPYARAWWLSYMYRYVPGKVMLLVERARLGVSLGIPAAPGAALAIVETLLAIAAGSAVSLFAVAWYAGDDARVLSGVLALSAAAIFLLPVLFRRFCRLPSVKSKFPDLESVALRPSDILLVVLPYVFHYLLLGCSFFLIARSLQLFDWSALPGLCGIYALSHVISLVALLAPAGLGVREGALAVQLGRALPTGVAEALAIGVRVWFTIIELLSFMFVMFTCPALPNEERQDVTSTR